jgi:nucleoside-diphosphate-sugar epimerase
MPRLLRAILTGKAKIIGPGDNRLNLTHAANEAEGCILAAEHAGAVGQAYNLSNDGVITQQEYFDRMADALGAARVKRHVPYRVAKSAALLMEVAGHALHRRQPPLVTRYAVWLMGRRCFFSCEKARQQLGWQPTISYEQGIAQAVAWCKKNAPLT